MKARAFALMIIAVLLCAMAAAGSAADIDNCCFVDRQCSTDQQWIDGYWAFQNNQCPAPAQSQPAGGAPAQIDNCCFVDRQCHSDQEWVDGYQAYQNNQCAAPAQTQSVASAPTTAQVDNCCYVDRQCSTDQDWINGYRAYQYLQCGAPGQSVLSVGQADNKRRGMRIEGSAEFIAQVNASLDFLKAQAPHWYDYTVFGLDWLLELPDGTIVTTSGDVKVQLFVSGWVSRYYLGETDTFAGVLVHEACHKYQQQFSLASGEVINFFSSGLEAERYCLTLEIEALEDCCPGYPGLPALRHLLANIDKPENQWWHGCDFVWWHGDESECD